MNPSLSPALTVRAVEVFKKDSSCCLFLFCFCDDSKTFPKTSPFKARLCGEHRDSDALVVVVVVLRWTSLRSEVTIGWPWPVSRKEAQLCWDGPGQFVLKRLNCCCCLFVFPCDYFIACLRLHSTDLEQTKNMKLCVFFYCFVFWFGLQFALI